MTRQLNIRHQTTVGHFRKAGYKKDSIFRCHLNWHKRIYSIVKFHRNTTNWAIFKVLDDERRIRYGNNLETIKIVLDDLWQSPRWRYTNRQNVSGGLERGTRFYELPLLPDRTIDVDPYYQQITSHWKNRPERQEKLDGKFSWIWHIVQIISCSLWRTPLIVLILL